MKTNVVRTAEKKREPNLLRAGIILGVAFVATLGIGLALQSASSGGDDEKQAAVASAERPGKKMKKTTTQRTAPRAAVAETTPDVATVSEAAAATAVEATTPMDEVPVTYEEAERVFLEGDYERAAILLGAYSRQKSENVWGHYLRGLALHRANRLEEAEQAYRSALEIDGDHAKTLVNLARTLLGNERPQEALSFATRASDAWPENGDAHRTRARALHTLGHAGEALDAYADALAIDPEDAWSLNNSGLILIQEERFAEAIGPLRKAGSVSPNEACFFNNLGVALERSGDLAGAKEAYAAAISVDADYDKSQVSLARVDQRIAEGGGSSLILVSEPANADETAAPEIASVASTEEEGPIQP